MTNKGTGKQESNQSGDYQARHDQFPIQEVSMRVTSQETSKLDMTKKWTGKQESNQSGDQQARHDQ